jgi:hypothetical protein
VRRGARGHSLFRRETWLKCRRRTGWRHAFATACLLGRLRLGRCRFRPPLGPLWLLSRRRNFLGSLYRFPGSGAPGNRAEMPPDPFRDILVDRAGMRLLLGNTELRQDCDNRAVRLLAFSRQLVNPDFLHIHVQLTCLA